ncbi:ABC-2 family transporter protein [Planctomycetes bacterium Pan216]|uniref:ABC-2 family transporter protein n=1 Tax=Kolteria novifilia TaxID=2527975 RepID=A0A518AX73_9BACT|nr:ABC-2 family transporter protein [Planctomycetes bacterium Pan216]
MKTFVIALTTYREIVRRPLFWIVIGIASVMLLVFFPLIPYYTMGEDIKMVKDQGLALIMVCGLIVAIFSASVSIADEIEGKTAITLLSKPINRRNFILGKYFGIMGAIFLLFLLLTVAFYISLFFKAGYDARENSTDAPTYFSRLKMFTEMAPGIVLAYCRVAILAALSVAFSTRLPVFLNITACILIFLLGHLAPQMVQASSQGQFEAVAFLARFFATILPGLEYFNIGPAISTDKVVPWIGYVLPCAIYTVFYVAVALLLALLMFEDRDLA